MTGRTDLQRLTAEELAERSTGHNVRCPICKDLMVLRRTDRFTYSNGDSRLFYGCRNFPECKSTHGAHPDGKPLGIPADRETKRWRMKAHESFDKLWKSHGLTRGESYKVLQKMMGMTEGEAHIGRFNIEQCKRLIALADSHGDALTVLSLST